MGDNTGEEPVDATADGPVLSSSIRKGAAWATGSNLVMRFANIAMTAILARLLSQDDFGVFAVALAVFLIASSLAELGMGSAVARSPEEPEDIAPTVISISIGFSLGLAVLLFVTATPLASLLGQPDAAEPLRILSLSLLLTGLFTVPGAQLVREFRQERVFLANVVGFLISNPILILLALNGGGATSFAWSRVIGQLATGLVMLASVRRYRPGWRRSAVRGLIAFGLPLSVANLVNFTLLNADYLIMGRRISAAEIGIYLIAFNVANWSTALMGSVLNTVVVPAFGRVVHDPPALASAVRTSVRLVAAVAFPIAAITMALAEPLVVTVFGQRWIASAPVLVVLALYGALYSFSLLFANVLVATGSTTRLLVVQLGWVSILVPGIWWGLEWGGLVGAAWAHVVSISLVALPVYVWSSLRATGQRLGDVLGVLSRPLLSAIVAAGVAGGTSWLLSLSGSPEVVRFLAGGLAGGLAYLVLAARELSLVLPDRLRDRLPRRPASREDSPT